MIKKTQTPNKLINEKSPYLLQHAYNPVNWYSWSEEAFKKAELENKPIFLSIGYSTCHWCHVMEKESFEDEEVAKLMNETFISIKVDREERPDIDHIYMFICQMMTGSGGWPLTVIMLPDKKPFFAGTYFPKYSKYGRVGMIDLTKKIKELWDSKSDDIFKSSEKIVEALKSSIDLKSGEILNTEIFDKAFKIFSYSFDKEYGGFGSAPKFPSPQNLLFLLKYYKRSKNIEALNIVEKTLTAMYLGGMYDQVGFGFHRYSTDRLWKLPHFEKMLYDQAMISIASIEAFQLTKNENFSNIAKEIFTYVLRDMSSEDGGFYSAEDADSEGEEGKFYLWSESEIKSLLGKDSDKIIELFNIEKNGNFEDEATKHKNSLNILFLSSDLNSFCEKYNLNTNEFSEKLNILKNKLFLEREKRIHPYKDDKILVDWNGLMIAAFSIGGRVLGNAEYIKVAEKAVSFILNNLKNKDGSLMHRFRDGEAAINANLDDYAFLIWGLIELYESTFKIEYLNRALEFNKFLIKHFWDEKSGGFYFTPDFGEELIVRKKEIYDGAIPSGNSVSLMNLIKLSKITRDSDLTKFVDMQIKAFSEEIKDSPHAYTQFLYSLDFYLSSPCEVILVGRKDEIQKTAMVKEINSFYKPNKIVIFKDIDNLSEIESTLNYLKDYKELNSKTTVYICENFACREPVNSIEDLKSLFEKM